ncbi:MAG: glucose-1-phosphate thymidylyltransferase, partial [Muribaculaceae bacterium]|nr:glucose-1-phosphate thymidylyltransferase [Muribaculaceae bacterium]
RQEYMHRGRLKVQCFGRGMAWLDTGTTDSLMDAANFIDAIQKRQGLKVAALEEIAFRKGFIDAKKLRSLAIPMLGNDYGKYLSELADTGI